MNTEHNTHHTEYNTNLASKQGSEQTKIKTCILCIHRDRNKNYVHFSQQATQIPTQKLLVYMK